MLTVEKREEKSRSAGNRVMEEIEAANECLNAKFQVSIVTSLEKWRSKAICQTYG